MSISVNRRNAEARLSRREYPSAAARVANELYTLRTTVASQALVIIEQNKQVLRLKRQVSEAIAALDRQMSEANAKLAKRRT